MADWAEILLGGDKPATPPPAAASGFDYAEDMLQSATPDQAANLAKDKFGAMQHSVTDQRAGSASLWTTLKASLPLDVQDRIKIFAKARGIPEDHYGVDKEGNIGYIDPVKGGWVREVPTLGGGSWRGTPADQFMRLGAQAADNAGPLVSQVAGGAAAAVAPPPLKIPAAGAVAGGVDLARQAAGKYLAGSDSPLNDLSYWNAAGQGALAAGGEATGLATGAGINKVYGRNTLRAAGADIPSLRDPAMLQKWQERQDEATARDIWLSPGNTTRADSLLVAERNIARQPEGKNILGNAYDRRNTKQVPTAVRNELDQVSTQTSPELGARSMQSGAEKVMQTLRDARTAAASPGYKAAFASGVTPDVQPVLDMITNALPGTAESSAARRALTTTYNDLTGKVTQQVGGKPVTARVPITNYEQMHSAKEAIDSTLASLEQKGFNKAEITKAKAALTPIQQRLTRILRDASPDYEAGYQAYINASPPVDAAKDGLVGLAARDRVLYKSVPNLLRTGDAVSIAQARALYEKTGQLGAWNDGVRAHVENSLRDALTPTQTGRPQNVAGKLYQHLYGDPTQRLNMEAALGGNVGSNARVESFAKLMDVLESAGTSLPEGSATATDLGARAQFTGKAAGTVANAVEGINVFKIPGRVAEGIRGWSQARNAKTLADIYTNSDAMGELANLRLMKPTSRQAITLVTNVLQKYGYLESPLLDKPQQTPPSLLSPSGAASGP